MTKIKFIFFFLTFSSIHLKSQDLLVNFSKTERTCELAAAEIIVLSGAMPVHFEWSNGIISNRADLLEPGNYSVKVKADNNQDTTIIFNIEELICEPAPENHFTPNGDEFNDTWRIGRIEYFPEFELFVYNRWGQLVQHQEYSYIPWDGRSLGLPLPDASYYYILYPQKSNRKNLLKGVISIIR